MRPKCVDSLAHDYPACDEAGERVMSLSAHPSDVLFRLVHATTGVPVTADDLEEIAQNEPWAEVLMDCDMDGFAVQSDGKPTPA